MARLLGVRCIGRCRKSKSVIRGKLHTLFHSLAVLTALRKMLRMRKPREAHLGVRCECTATLQFNFSRDSYYNIEVQKSE